MAIQSTFSYRGKSGSLKEAVGAIVQARAGTVIKSYKVLLEHRLKRVAIIWQAWLRAQLSVRGSSRSRNPSPWPRQREGKLMASIQRPDVQVSKYSGPASDLPSYKFKLKGLFGIRSSKTLPDVGQYLNDWSDKPFSGWKIRAQRNLYERMMRQVKATTLRG